MNKDEYFKTLKRICGLAAQIGLDHFMGSDTSKEETAYKDALVKLTDDYADLNIELYRLKNEIASAPVHIAAADTAENKRLREALESLRQKHYTCEDGWYSCPKCEEGCLDERAGSECNCGAEQQNAIIDNALKGGK